MESTIDPSWMGSFITAGLVVLTTILGYFFVKLYHARMLIVELRKKGLPIAPGHSFVFGHLLLLKQLADAMPKDAHYQYMFGDIARKYFMNEGVYYVDLWPMSGLFVTVVSPTAAIQAAQTNHHLSMERPALLDRFFKPIAGGPNLFNLPEKEWRPLRAVFNKGFNAEHVLSLVPGIVRQTRTYSETLRALASKGELFYLDTTTLRFTMDVIGKTILNTELGAQRGYNILADCMLNQIKWMQANAEGNPFGFFNVPRWYVQWWNGRQMDQYIGKELEKRYSEYKADSSNTRTKAVIDLVIQASIPEDVPEKPEKLDPEFRAFATRQIRLFVFAGHDSTSSTICYILHLLAKNPDTLSRIRAEHDEIFGKDISTALSMLERQPSLANSLPYTTAVIKETMRLFPPAGASRAGKPNQSLTDDQGNICPTDDAMIFVYHVGMHRSPKYWKRAEEFLPERWLVDPGHELYPMKGAWRPFELGPRNCIAQGLVMTELRVILACIVREFDFQPAYDEWDQSHPSRGLKTYRGERAYQVEEGAAHPADHYPCRVTLRTP